MLKTTAQTTIEFTLQQLVNMKELGYIIYNTEDILGKEKYLMLLNEIKQFNENFKKNLHEKRFFLNMGHICNEVKDQLIKLYPVEGPTILQSNDISFEDFKKFCEVNKILNISSPKILSKDCVNDGGMPCDFRYFNFFLKTDPMISPLLNEVYGHITYSLTGKSKKITGHMNVYPQGSFIEPHRDKAPNRQFLSLMFLNFGRTKEQGSLTRLLIEDDVIEIVPDISQVLVLESDKFDYIHDVTENLSEDIRYTIYAPIEIV